MKKKFLFIYLFLFGTLSGINAQISMIGTALTTELDMAQFNLYEFQQQATFTAGNIKFRQGHSWTTNWGSTAFPTGMGVQDGLDIPVTAGTYIVSFNSATGAYSFVSTTPTPVISIVGTGVNGWPGSQIGPEITFSTIDGVTYTKSNLTVSTGEIKFRQDLAWATNWGGETFPSGQGILNSLTNIPTTAGNYNVTFNRNNGTYTFITSFPTVGLIGPAVNAVLGYLCPEVPFSTEDGENYLLSAFYYNGGGGYFKINSTTTSYGSTAFPIGTAVSSGPPLSIPGGEFTCKYNITTQNYSFGFPSVGILGTALNGFDTSDVDLQTTNGFTYTINGLALSAGEVKFRLDDHWVKNWGAIDFPSGTGVQDGTNITIPSAGIYDVVFERSSGVYAFSQVLTINDFDKKNYLVFPNPASKTITINLNNSKIIGILLTSTAGKMVFKKDAINDNQYQLDISSYASGSYTLRIETNEGKFFTKKLIKN